MIVKKPFRERVNVRLPPDLVARAKQFAKVRRVSFTEVVESALIDAVGPEQPKKKVNHAGP